MKPILFFSSIAIIVLTGAQCLSQTYPTVQLPTTQVREIESENKTEPVQRGLFGYSLGGTFTTFSLFYKPGLFQYYFIGDTMLSWDDWAIFDFDQTDKLIGTSDTVNVYFTWCDMEPGDDSNIPLIRFLKENNNPHIIYKSEVLEDETHLSGIGLSYSRAFRGLYDL